MNEDRGVVTILAWRADGNIEMGTVGSAEKTGHCPPMNILATSGHETRD